MDDSRIGKADFLGDESGAMTFLILPMFILLVVLSGLTLDMYMEETHREDLQDALDRGVLAAGAPHQGADREQVVWSYINTRTYNDKQANANISVEDETTYTRVTAASGFDMDTTVFSLLHTKSMPIIAASEAFEGEEKLEVSLVLDISGSMARYTSTGTTLNRLELMKTAAKDFVTGLLSRANASSISISLVPYAGQVNAGAFFDVYAPRIYDAYANSCVDFEDADFSTALMPDALARVQAPQSQNFAYEADYGFDAAWGSCPGDALAILPFSNDIAALHAAIDAFTGHDGTGTQIGMKWGMALLDPSLQTTVETLFSSGSISMPGGFVGRPAAYSDNRTTKYLVVMTDGNIRYQNRPKPEFMDGSAGFTADYWGDGPNYVDYGFTYPTARNLLLRKTYASTLGNAELREADEALRVQQFMDLCGIAKSNDIRIFTIGFDIETTDDAYDEMRNCASVPGDFFDVDGTDLNSAFDQILQAIAKLQLTQ